MIIKDFLHLYLGLFLLVIQAMYPHRNSYFFSSYWCCFELGDLIACEFLSCASRAFKKRKSCLHLLLMARSTFCRSYLSIHLRSYCEIIIFLLPWQSGLLDLYNYLGWIDNIPRCSSIYTCYKATRVSVALSSWELAFIFRRKLAFFLVLCQGLLFPNIFLVFFQSSVFLEVA